jgi:hypothetical protein
MSQKMDRAESVDASLAALPDEARATWRRALRI